MATTRDEEVRVEQGSLGSLFSRMTGDVSTLVRKELELAKVEIKEEAKAAGKASGKLGVAALTGYLSVLFASLAVAFLLDQLMPTSLAFAIVAILYGIAALVMARSGRRQLKTVNPRPEETVETLREDVEWAKARKN